MSARHQSLGAALSALGFVRADLEPAARKAHRVVFTRGSMATRVRVSVVDASPARAEEAAGRALDEMDRVVKLLDRHATDSAVSVLNDHGRLGTAPPELLDVLAEARRLHRETLGAFDVSVKPLLDHVRASAAPPPEDVLRLADMSALVVTGRGVRLGKAGMGLTLDGLAKGYVVDRMARVLTERRARRWLIEAGGDVRACGLREDGRPWRVGVRDPGGRSPCPEVTTLTRGAVATSGGYEQPFDALGRRHHIVHADDRGSPHRVASATVCAPTAAMADALATAAFVLGRRAVPLIDSLPGCSCFLLDDRDQRVASRRWRGLEATRP